MLAPLLLSDEQVVLDTPLFPPCPASMAAHFIFFFSFGGT
jgi:hypothetical protein